MNNKITQFRLLITTLISFTFLIGCGPEKTEEQTSENKPTEQAKPRVVPPDFNAIISVSEIFGIIFLIRLNKKRYIL